MQMQVLCTVKQAHTGKQANQAKIMITMQVGDKNVIYFAAFYLVLRQLHLGSFAAVDQKTFFHGL
jgi:hypothetical protein